MFLILPLIFLLAAFPALAQDPIPLVRNDNWAGAQSIAAANPDPVAAKLVLYYRLLTPNAAGVVEISDFIAANPDWPAQAQLDKRRQEALASERDDGLARLECDRQLPTGPLTNALALQRCANAYESGGRHDDAVRAASQSDTASSGGSVTPMLDQARSLRRSGQEADALVLWLAQGPSAQASVPASKLPEYWTERHALARRLLRDGDDKGAYALVTAHGQSAPEQTTDAEFLAGWIALRRLKQPNTAIRHFNTLAAGSRSIITQGRAWYWLGRAESAAGRDTKPAFTRAAVWPTTFYGQLASLALGEDLPTLARRISAVRDPGFTQQDTSNLGGRELADAAALLAGWSEPRRAHAFLLRLDELSPDPANRALTARYASALNLPEMAVFIARRMGRDGVPLPEAGWPMPVEPPSTQSQVTAALALGIMRQESSFETAVVSPAGARGLMQLMPATAQIVARQTGEGTSLTMLTGDPQHNMRLGTVYLAGLIDRFGGSLPLAIAGYNAGPGRVDTWLADNGDPRPGAVGVPIDMIDWIELIPINETRNYVQRVLENVVVYEAKRGEGRLGSAQTRRNQALAVNNQGPGAELAKVSTGPFGTVGKLAEGWPPTGLGNAQP